MLKLNENANLNRYDWTAARLPELVSKAPAKHVADIGAGDGRMQAAVEKAGGIWNGFDLFPQSSNILRWDLDEACPGTERPGVAIMLDVVEHLNNPWNAIRNVSDYLLPGGYLIITTPNPLWSRSRLLAVLEGEPPCFTQSDLDLNHHVFVPWPHIVQQLLLDRNMVVEHYATIDGKTQWPGAPYNLRYPVRILFSLLGQWIEGRDPRACGMSYAFIARKKS